MLTKKKFAEQNGLDLSKVFELVLGQGGSILPGRGFTGYMAEITESSLVCTNDKLGVKKEIPFSLFERAEFGIGNGLLWLQCVVDGEGFVFSSPRKGWKSEAGKLLLERIGEHTEIIDMKEYEHYTGKLFFIYMWK